MVNKAVWQGPEGKGPQGGVTVGLLNRFLFCRERFRAHALEGIRTCPQWNHRTEYGTIFHLAEEVYAQGDDWRAAILRHCETLAMRFPFDRDEIDRWYNVCLVQFPVYLDYWRSHPEPFSVQTVEREQVFDVPYPLPSGRVVRLRGRRDGVDLINGCLYLDEKKTKGDVDREQIGRQLTYDLQVMTYLIALHEEPSCDLPREGHYRHGGGESVRGVTRSGGVPAGEYPIQGVRYNVVRRPLSGGEGDIRQKKGSKNIPAETTEEYYARLKGVIDGTGLNSKGEPYTGPEAWFFRWQVDVAPGDISNFKRKTLDPLLEYLCLWYDSQIGRPWTGRCNDAVPDCLHWQTPYGIYNPLLDGGQSDLDAYVTSGDMTGLVKVMETFPELNEER